jgi:hypothetical protein
MLETPSMKYEGLQYFQSHLVKQQATEKKLFWIREKCKNMRDGSRFDLINCDFLFGSVKKKHMAHGTGSCSF